MKVRMERIKCRYCGKILEKHDMMYQVRIIETNGEEVYSPTCSRACANRLKTKYLDIHRKRVSSLENQSFQYMTVENYFRQ